MVLWFDMPLGMKVWVVFKSAKPYIIIQVMQDSSTHQHKAIPRKLMFRNSFNLD